MDVQFSFEDCLSLWQVGCESRGFNGSVWGLHRTKSSSSSRLETRTKESIMCASKLVLNQCAQ